MKITKRISAFLAAALIAAFAFVLPASAAGLTEDGTYTVPVTLYHASKDKESYGNKYIVPTALITVDNGKKYITVVTDGVDDLTFSYYLDGSTEGEKAEAETVKNVEINGTVYSMGFRFPLVTDNSEVGVAFKSPAMPFSPSARLRIDYSGAKLIKAASAATTVKQTAKASESTVKETSSAADETETSVAEAETDEITEAGAETILSETQTTETISETEEITSETETEASADTEESGSTSPVLYIVSAVAVIAVAAVVIVVIKKKKG